VKRSIACSPAVELDLVFKSLLAGKVPPHWLKTYPSLKPLGSWTRDLLQRVDQLARWAEGTYPLYYWLSGFTYPTAFLTAVLQTTARKNSIPIDTLSFDFAVLNVDPAEITTPPKEGVYAHGLYLEGAGWDFEEVRLRARPRSSPSEVSWSSTLDLTSSS
jgi:dynein heavy chain, axonemal